MKVWLVVAALLLGCRGGADEAEGKLKAMAGDGRILRAPSSSMAPTIPIDAELRIDKRPSRIDRGTIVAFRHPCLPDREFVKRVVAIEQDTLELRCGKLYVNGQALPRDPVTGPCIVRDREADGSAYYSKPCTRFHEGTYDVYGRAEADAGPSPDDFPQLPYVPVGCQGIEGASSLPMTAVATATETGGCQAHMHVVVPAGSYFLLGDYRNNSNDSRYWGVVPDANITGVVTAIW